MSKIIAALRKEHPKAQRIVKNESCNGFDVIYADDIMEECYTYKVTGNRAYLIGIVSCEV